MDITNPYQLALMNHIATGGSCGSGSAANDPPWYVCVAFMLFIFGTVILISWKEEKLKMGFAIGLIPLTIAAVMLWNNLGVSGKPDEKAEAVIKECMGHKLVWSHVEEKVVALEFDNGKFIVVRIK